MKKRLPLWLYLSSTALLAVVAIVGLVDLFAADEARVAPSPSNVQDKPAAGSYRSTQTRSDLLSKDSAREAVGDRRTYQSLSFPSPGADKSKMVANPNEYATQERWRSTIVPCWRLRGSAPEEYAVSLDPNIRSQGAFSAAIEPTRQPTGYGTLYQFADATPLRGERIAVSFDVRIKSVANANLFVRVDDARGRALAMDNYRTFSGDSDWSTEQLVIDVPSDAKAISYGLVLNGPGKAWIDGVRLEITGTGVPITGFVYSAPMLTDVTPFPLSYAVGEPKNLDFESTARESSPCTAPGFSMAK